MFNVDAESVSCLTMYVNFFGGPNTGKTTMAQALNSVLRLDGISSEYIDEYAKAKVWERSRFSLEDQVYISATQRHKILRCEGDYDVLVVDSPYIMGLMYGMYEPEYAEFLIDDFKRHNVNSLNIFLERSIPFHKAGRVHTEEDSLVLDNSIVDMLVEEEIPFVSTKNNGWDTVYGIASMVRDKLGLL